MLSIPAEVSVCYAEYLNKRRVARTCHEEYTKHLSDFLSYCRSLTCSAGNSQRVRLFLYSLRKTISPRRNVSTLLMLYLFMFKC